MYSTIEPSKLMLNNMISMIDLKPGPLERNELNDVAKYKLKMSRGGFGLKGLGLKADKIN